MKKCFTINPFRTTEEIKSYHILLRNNIYQAIEIFYPYELDQSSFNKYTDNIKELMMFKPEIVMHLPFGKKNDLCNFAEFSEVISLMKKAITYSKSFNINKFTLHLGEVNNNSRDTVIKHIIETLKDLCDFAYPRNLMIENMPGIGEMGYSPQEIEYIIKTVDKINLKFILDTGHANVSKYKISDYLNILKPYLMHIHINDNNGKSDEHKRIGMGNIDFRGLITMLNDYQELYCLEILYKDVNDLILYADDFDKISM